MAATACAAYAYEEARPLMPATPATPPPQVSEPPPSHLDDCAVKPVLPPAPPPPPRLLRSSIFPRHPGLCTEGLGSESSGDVDLDDDLINDNVQDWQGRPRERQPPPPRDSDGEPARTRISEERAFPPPISVIGAGGKPWLYLRPHREDGRLVLREVRIPSQELLQARREDGRFKLHFAPPQPEEEEQLVQVHQC